MANTSQVFVPNEAQIEKMPDFLQNNVPQFLFRIHSTSRAESTDAKHAGSWVSSRASETGEMDKVKDLFALPRHIAAARLNEHLQGQCWDDFKSNLVSWTASLLYAIQFGLYKRATSAGNVKLSQIYLMVLDTQSFPPGTFTQDLELLEVFYKHERYSDPSKNLENLYAYRSMDNSYPGEYFSQGNLNVQGQFIQTSLGELIDHGLFELNPVFKEEDLWFEPLIRLEGLREPFRQDDIARITSEAEFHLAIAIARLCFGGKWAVPMALLLLSLRPRQSPDHNLEHGFRACFSGKSCPISNETLFQTVDDRPDTELYVLPVLATVTNANKLPEVALYERLRCDLSKIFSSPPIYVE